MKTLEGLVLAGAFVLVGACSAPVPTGQLVGARTAYAAAASGPAGELAPVQLRDAHAQLAAAEGSLAREGHTFRTRDLAYIAVRRAQLADARAQTVEYDQEVNLARYQVELTAARQATEAGRFASVKQDARGTVLTIPAAALFTSSQYELMPSAQTDLVQVVEVLSKTDNGGAIVVSGYSDSEGNESYAVELSRRRAESVKDFLIAHGVAADRIVAQGFGAAQPISSNDTPEGRAGNRRVEIVVQPPKAPLAPSR